MGWDIAGTISTLGGYVDQASPYIEQVQSLLAEDPETIVQSTVIEREVVQQVPSETSVTASTVEIPWKKIGIGAGVAGGLGLGALVVKKLLD